MSSLLPTILAGTFSSCFTNAISNYSSNIMLDDQFLIGLPNSGEIAALSSHINTVEGVTATSPDAFALVATIDVSPGRTQRRFTDSTGAKHLITISHQETGENKPFTTIRCLIRHDHYKVNAETGKEVVQSSYLVVTLPQGPDFTTTKCFENTAALLYWILFGSLDAGNGNVFANNGPLMRVLQGEP